MAVKKDKLSKNDQLLSMVLGVLVLVAVGYFVYNFFRSVNKQNEIIQKTEKQEETLPKAKELPKEYSVVQGDYLWTISEKVYGSGYYWPDIAQANNLINPDYIVVGQKLNLPKLEIKEGSVNGNGSNTSDQQAITKSNYTVGKGDNLWNISIRACGDGYKWTNIAKLNSLTNPDLIHQGNVLKMSCD